jgi:hypothetical protein
MHLPIPEQGRWPGSVVCVCGGEAKDGGWPASCWGSWTPRLSCGWGSRVLCAGRWVTAASRFLCGHDDQVLGGCLVTHVLLPTLSVDTALAGGAGSGDRRGVAAMHREGKSPGKVAAQAGSADGRAPSLVSALGQAGPPDRESGCAAGRPSRNDRVLAWPRHGPRRLPARTGCATAAGWPCRLGFQGAMMQPCGD